MRNSYLAVFSVVLLFSFCEVARAEVVQGRVVNSNSGALVLTVFDAKNNPYPNSLHLKVDSQTKMTGYSYASPPRAKDMVRVDARQGRNGQWRADSISKLKTSGMPQPVASAPGPSLMDTLKSPGGQTVIKRGLTGALVGGVASGASGGKAGKGALIGAGAGILGGWLSDTLSGPAQSQAGAPAVTYQDSRSQ